MLDGAGGIDRNGGRNGIVGPLVPHLHHPAPGRQQQAKGKSAGPVSWPPPWLASRLRRGLSAVQQRACVGDELGLVTWQARVTRCASKHLLARWNSMRRLAIFLMLPLGACVSASSRNGLSSPAPIFSVERFFTGSTEGRGIIKTAVSKGKNAQVHGTGRLEADGTLVLDQRVEQMGAKEQHRQWRFNKVGAGRYSGTLTDAIGPVIGETDGNCLHLHYKLKQHGFDTEQWLYLQQDQRIVLNRMIVRKLGVTVATLDETIRHVE